jgi:hypothetical protein
MSFCVRHSASSFSASITILSVVRQASETEWAFLSLVLFNPVLDDLLFWDVCSSGSLGSIAIAEAWFFLSDLAFSIVASSIMVVLESAFMPLLICSSKDVATKLNHFNQLAQPS